MSAKSLRRGGSLCSPDPYSQLLSAVVQRDLVTLRAVLRQQDVNPDHWYEDPHYGTCLYVACGRRSDPHSVDEYNSQQFVDTLIEFGADPNKMNPVRKNAPLHAALEAGNISALEALVNNSSTIMDVQDDYGNTALHVAAKKLKTDLDVYGRCISLLLSREDTQVNCVNRKGYTAIHLVAQNGTSAIVKSMLQNSKHTMILDTFKISNGKTARDVILERFPELGEHLPPKILSDTDEISSTKLFQYLYSKSSDLYIEAMTKHIKEGGKLEILNAQDGKYTFLQYACDYGLSDVVSYLLENGANPNLTLSTNMRSPVLLACTNGHYRIVQLLLSNNKTNWLPCSGETVLHAVVKETKNVHLITSSEDADHNKCLDLLLLHLDYIKVDINAVDFKGNTALHYATQYDNDYAVLALLSKDAYIGIQNVYGDLPLANMSPATLEAFLDGCLITNDEFPREDTFELVFKYNFLFPTGNTQVKERKEPADAMAIPLHDKRSSEGQTPQGESRVPETSPLLYVSQSRDLKHLLKHPIFTSFLYLKWHRIRFLFYINFIFYITFVALLTTYILCSYGKSTKTDDEPRDDLAEKLTDTNFNTTKIYLKTLNYGFVNYIWFFLLCFSVVLALRELFQLAVSFKKYLLSFENYLELSLVGLSGVILFCYWDDSQIRKHFSAIAILLSWAELVLLIGRHPLLSTNIEMLKTVSWNFLKFLAWYSILIVAFALSFYTLFRDYQSPDGKDDEDNFFLDPGMSILKTVVMLTGEFDATSIPFFSYPGTSQAVFLLFVFLIAIVLFNLLNGLAVGDTQAIRNDAELVGYISRVNLIHHFENVLLGNPLSWFETLNKYACCLPIFNCLSSRSYVFGFLLDRVRLFPNVLARKRIHVLPNQGARILFNPPGSSSSRNCLDGNDACCCSGCCPVCEHCSGCWMAPHVLRAALDVVSTRGKPQRVTNLRELLMDNQCQLEEFQKKLDLNQQKLYEYEKHFVDMEQTLRQNESLLKEILSCLVHPVNSDTRGAIVR